MRDTLLNMCFVFFRHLYIRDMHCITQLRVLLSIIELPFQLSEELQSTLDLDMPEEDELTYLRKCHNRLTNHLEILTYYGIGRLFSRTRESIRTAKQMFIF